MYVWLHSKSPPQHIACITESTVATSDKLRDYMAHVNTTRLVNLKWAGVFENDHGETSVHLFWDAERPEAFITRMCGVIISTED